MYNRKLLPQTQEHPILLSVDVQRMTSLIQGLPGTIKLMAIQLQGKLQALLPLKRVIAALRGTTSPAASGSLDWEGKVWALGDVTWDSINFGQKYGLVKTTVSLPQTCAMRPGMAPDYDPGFLPTPVLVEDSTH